jgi:hypothetical protein
MRRWIVFFVSLLSVMSLCAVESQQKQRVFRELYSLPPTAPENSQQFSTMGRYQGVRDSSHETVASMDIQAFTYTRKNDFAVFIYFERKSPDEGKRVPHGDLFMMDLHMDLETYSSLFESKETVEIGPWESIVYNVVASAKTENGRRVIEFYQESTVSAEDPVITRKGKAVLTLSDGQVHSIHMQKWARRGLLNPIGWIKKWDKVFDDTMIMSQRVKIGMALRDEGEVGRAVSESQIRSAIGEQTPDAYRKAVKN